MERKAYITACRHYLVTYDCTLNRTAHRAITEQERRNERTEAAQIAHYERNEIPHLLSIYKEDIWNGSTYIMSRYITTFDGARRYVYSHDGERMVTVLARIIEDYEEHIRRKYCNEQNPL